MISLKSIFKATEKKDKEMGLGDANAEPKAPAKAYVPNRAERRRRMRAAINHRKRRLGRTGGRMLDVRAQTIAKAKRKRMAKRRAN